MSSTIHTIELAGCSPTPLANYLKALGILRVVSEQVDSKAKGWWKDDVFWLQSSLDRNAHCDFFTKQYCPTPLVTPWNGGSGFRPQDNQEALLTIANSKHDRFESYRTVIDQCQQILNSLPNDFEKPQLLQVFRNRLPDEVLPWLDAAYVLTSDGPKYPPLLGTGGNDGRLEFTNNFMQHILMLFDGDGKPSNDSHVRFEECAFREISNCRHRGTIGQYDPGNLGGANNGSGFEGYSTVNSWDYVLMLEGAILFAAAASKKLDASGSGTLSYPFCVRPATVGYGSASGADEELSRAEMWLPIWGQPTNAQSLTILFSEGRAETRTRKARNGVDFARAVSALGVDRGIDEFQRIGFQQRNGLAYFAVPLGRFRVKANPSVEELLGPIDGWLDRFRRAATGKNSPERARRALRQLERAILYLCTRGDSDSVQATLLALGEAEASVAISKELREGSMGSGINPLPPLDLNWIIKANDHSIEFRLAVALASISDPAIGPIRRHLEPLDPKFWRSKFPKWASPADDPAIVWGSGSLVKNLCNVLMRRLLDVGRSGSSEGDSLVAPIHGQFHVTLTDIDAFIQAEVDEPKIASLFQSLCLVDFSRSQEESLPVAEALRPVQSSDHHDPIDAGYAILKLCFLPFDLKERAVRLHPPIAHSAAIGDAGEAIRQAVRRLRADGRTAAFHCLALSPERTVRTAAALLFPISGFDANRLADTVLLPAQANTK